MTTAILIREITEEETIFPETRAFIRKLPIFVELKEITLHPIDLSNSFRIFEDDDDNSFLEIRVHYDRVEFYSGVANTYNCSVLRPFVSVNDMLATHEQFLEEHVWESD